MDDNNNDNNDDNNNPNEPCDDSDNNNDNNNPNEPCDDSEDDASRYLILDNPYSLFSVPSPTLTLPPRPPPSTQIIPEPTVTENADSPELNNCDDGDLSFLDSLPPMMFEPDFFKELDFKTDEEINVGRGVGGGDSGAGPSGTKELAFQYIRRSVLDCDKCHFVCLVFDSSNGLYNMGFQVHKVADELVHLILDVHPSDPEVDTGVDTYFLDFCGYDLEKINRDVAKYSIYLDQTGRIHVLDSFFNVYNKILEGLINKDQLYTDINSINDDHHNNIIINNNNNLQIDNQQQNDPPLSPLFEEEAEGQDDDQLLDELDLENLNDVNVVEQVYPWMAERADSASSSDSEGSPRPSIAIQRERTAQWTLLDLAPYFHIKAEKASKKLKVCPTTLKIVCRRLNLRRWPYRKISSIDNKICGLKRHLREKIQQGDMHGIISLKDEIEKEKQKRVRLYLLLTRDSHTEAN